MVGVVRVDLVCSVSANEMENREGASGVLVKPFRGDTEKEVVVDDEVSTSKDLCCHRVPRPSRGHRQVAIRR
jgi:hypothetical protein